MATAVWGYMFGCILIDGHVFLGEMPPYDAWKRANGGGAPLYDGGGDGRGDSHMSAGVTDHGGTRRSSVQCRLFYGAHTGLGANAGSTA